MEEDICTTSSTTATTTANIHTCSNNNNIITPCLQQQRLSSPQPSTSFKKTPKVFILTTLLVWVAMLAGAAEGYWCVTRSDASDDALQTSMDYACGSGADCAPIQSDGLCYLPNTIQAHASYAFNSYYQRSNMAPGACEFGGAATLAKTDPSYGSCVYPPDPRTAGVGSMSSPPTPTDSSSDGTNSTYAGTTPVDSSGGMTSPILGPPIATTNNDAAPSSAATTLLILVLLLSSLWILSS